MKSGVRCLLMLCLGALTVLSAFAGEGRTPIFQVGTVIAAPGRYIVTQDLIGTGAAPIIEITVADVDVDLNGFTLQNASGPAAVILVDGVLNVSIHGGSLVGGGMGIDIPSGGYNHTIEDVRIRATSGKGIHATSGTLVIRRSTVSYLTGIGILSEFPHSCSIEDSVVIGTGAEGVRINGGTARIVRTTITDSGSYDILINTGYNDVIQDNVVTGGVGLSAMRLQSLQAGDISGNQIQGAAAECVHLDSGTAGVTLRNNNISNCGNQIPYGGDDIVVDGVRNTIEGNLLTGAYNFGLHFTTTAGNNTYGRNTARGNNGGGAPCAGTLYYPDFCDDGSGDTSFGDNLIPGPPLH